MRDLNDLYYFAMVVDHGGFTPAQRALGIPKSRLSRRIAQLEVDLGVRLLQRSTRQFAITDVGNSVYRHAQSMLAEAQAVHEVVDLIGGKPRGSIRVGVPVGLAQQCILRMLPEFLARFPEVRVELVVRDHRMDIINEGIDVALRVRSTLDSDSSLVMRGFGQVRDCLVASPEYLRRTSSPIDPDELAGHSTLSIRDVEAGQYWELHGPDGTMRRVELCPRVTGLDFPMLMTLAQEGAGIAALPEALCGPAVRGGDLEVVLPGWRLPKRTFHAVFPSRRGLLPAVRAFIDFLADTAPRVLESACLQPPAATPFNFPGGRTNVEAPTSGAFAAGPVW